MNPRHGCVPSRRSFLAGGLAAAVPRPGDAAARRPNIILCMGDDHGWHETGYYDHPHLRTPALDDMASRGVRFDRFYAAAPVCSPTRGSVMTGRHPNRYGTFAPNFSIRPEERTLPRILREAGYVCGHFGKWHLGPVKKGSPTNPGAMGFHHWFSHDNFFGFNPPLARDGAEPVRVPGESSEIVAREAIRFIREAAGAGKPFFAVVWFGSPHGPYAGMDEDLIPFQNVKDEKFKHRYAEITAMDRAIGALRRFLRDEKLSGDTLFWYNSDNGIPSDCVEGSRLRGSKGNLYENGVRVPAVVEFPAMISKPLLTTVPAVTSDILPTVCGLLDLPLPGRPLDGISIVPLLEGRMKERPQPICFWQYDTGREAKESPGPYLPDEAQRGTTPTSRVREIEFRNYRHPRARTGGFTGMAAVVDNRYKLVAPRKGPLELYDIPADSRETNNLAAQHPGLVAGMEKTLRAWQRSVEVSLTGADYKPL